MNDTGRYSGCLDDVFFPFVVWVAARNLVATEVAWHWLNADYHQWWCAPGHTEGDVVRTAECIDVNDDFGLETFNP